MLLLLLLLLLLLFTLSGFSQESEQSADDNSQPQDLQRIQVEDTYSKSNSQNNTEPQANDEKKKRFTREDFLEGRVELNDQIIMRSFFFGRNVFPSKFEGDKDLYRGTQIAKNIFSGSSLIYDCKLEYWACVSFEDANKCVERRSFDLKRYKQNLSCAFLKQYENLFSLKNPKSILFGDIFLQLRNSL